jgi:hypothetical protein
MHSLGKINSWQCYREATLGTWVHHGMPHTTTHGIYMNYLAYTILSYTQTPEMLGFRTKHALLVQNK